MHTILLTVPCTSLDY